MNNICIIPARGGSKRIPRKNIKDFLGKPIIAYSIELALNSNLFDEVMVSTDDSEIAEIAVKYGAKVPFMRSEENANDFSGLAEVIEEVLFEYRKLGEDYNNFCCILSTSPLIRITDLKSGYDLLIKNNFDSVYPIVQFSYPILRSLNLDENKKITMNWPEYYNSRSQDLKSAYHDSGTFYWMKSEKLLQYKKLITPNTGGIIIDELLVQDIDTETDWKLAELKYELLQNTK
ncbi:MAG: pseF [Bacteroidetes bacterium]|nr:pseF [Bacteroidota bacterium]